MSILKYQKDFKAHKKAAKTYKADEEDGAAHEYFLERKAELQEYRKLVGVEEIWRAADKAYVPHTLKAGSGKKVLISNDEVGWRATQQIINKPDAWQEDSVPPNPYIKIQTALGIIVDRNPTAVLKPRTKKFEKNTLLYKNLYETSWDTAKSRTAMLKPVVFNMAKYGMGVGRTFNYTLKRNVEDIDAVDPKTGKVTYKSSEHIYYNDIFRESITPWQVWFDDGAQIGNPFSCEDVMWYKDYSWDKFCEQFGDLPARLLVGQLLQVLDQVVRVG